MWNKDRTFNWIPRKRWTVMAERQQGQLPTWLDTTPL